MVDLKSPNSCVSIVFPSVIEEGASLPGAVDLGLRGMYSQGTDEF